MKYRRTPAPAAALLVLCAILSVYGQQSSPANEARISQLRTNIQRMLQSAPPPNSPEEAGYRRALAALQQQLQSLLTDRRQSLQTRIKTLDAPDALPEVAAHVQELKRELQKANEELQAFQSQPANGDGRSADGGDGTAANSSTQPARSVPAQPQTSTFSPQADKARRADFEQAVKNFVADPKALSDAAAPKVAADNLPVVGCNELGRPASTKFSKYDEYICRLAQGLADENRQILLEQDKAPLLTILIAKLLKTTGAESYSSMVTDAQEARIDQQMGAGPASSGTTSLVSKGGIPYLLGLAVENGAAVESRSGTAVTFRLNPAGMVKLFEQKGFITGFREVQADPPMNFLRKTSVGVSFDTDRGNQPGVFIGDRQQLSAISARFEFVNDRDPRLKKYARDWEEFVANDGVEFAQNVWATTLAIENFGGRNDQDSFKDPALQAWLVATNNSLATITGTDRLSKINAIASVLRTRADLLPVKLVAPETVAAITSFAHHLRAYTEAKDAIFDKIAAGRIFTLDYVNKREVNAPDTSNFTFIAATGIGRGDLTANGSFTFFNTRPVATLANPRPDRVRDFQFAAQIDLPFKLGEGNFDFWFSGRYERLLTDAFTQAGTVMPSTKGDIAVGQVGLSIPIKSLGIRFPVSITFANRTELIKEREVRGNIGFTFNWDTLLSWLKPF
jgi:hypothetical protein